MVKIKCIFPRNYYLLRKINIKIDNHIVASVGHNEIVELNVLGKNIEFKLDYHKTEIMLPDSKNDIFLILYFNFRNYFPFFITDIMFKNSLRVKLVEKTEFENFNESFYERQTVELVKFNNTVIYTIILGILISSELLIMPFLKFNNSINNFSFFIGLISLIGFVLMIMNKKRTTERQYNIKILAFGLSSVLLLSFLNINTIVKFVSIILSFNIIFISIKNLIRSLRKISNAGKNDKNDEYKT
jgi:hypothetical protein